jgi:acyloxyacyl hydrolase
MGAAWGAALCQVDGFHPSQLAQPLITEQFWKYLSAELPEAMPPVNPNNDAIQRVFGDQGGY